MSKIQAPTQGFNVALRATYWHAWEILRFRHRGAGLLMSDMALLTVCCMGVLAVLATAILTPSSAVPHHPLYVAAIMAATFACCFSFCGRICAAGFAVTIIATEPVAIVLRLAGLEEVDVLFTIWVIAGQLIFFFRAAGAEKRA